MLFGFVFKKNRHLITSICKKFGYGKKFPDPLLPQIEIGELISENYPIKIFEPVGVNGNISMIETYVAISLVKQFNPINIFEIGTFNGRTTLNMAYNSSKESRVYTLDLPGEEIESTAMPIVNDDKVFIEKESSGSRIIGQDPENKILQLYGDSASFDFTEFRNDMDFVFIDGSHSYEYVLNDSRQAIKLLRNSRGVILWHDYNNSAWEGVTRALNELYRGDEEFSEIKHIKGTCLACLIISH